jgi:predicted dehydrogenase
VIFVATPHRGSYKNTSFVQKILNRFIKLSSDVNNAFAGLLKSEEKIRIPSLVRGKIPTSLNGMSTDNPFMLTLADIPVAPGIKANSIIAIQAMGAGKDVYCEKPLTLFIAEGRQMVNVARQYGTVVQVGSQQRSDWRFRQAVELVKANRIGRLKRITSHLGNPGTTTGAFINPGVWEAARTPPDGLDFDMWLGPAPFHDYSPNRCHFEFRYNLDHSGGRITDWGAHHNDIAQWALGADEAGPVLIDGKGAFPTSGLFDTPITYEVNYTYPSGVKLTCSSDGNGCWFYGTEGEIYVNRGQLSSKPAEIIQKPTGKDEVHLYESANHYRNFLDCVKQRKKPICDVEVGQRSVSVCHLGNISIRLGRPIRWDPTAERIVDDEEANRWLSRPMRAPWHL